MYAHSLLAITAHLPITLWKEDEDSLCFVAGPTVLPMQRDLRAQRSDKRCLASCLVRRRRRSTQQTEPLNLKGSETVPAMDVARRSMAYAYGGQHVRRRSFTHDMSSC